MTIRAAVDHVASQQFAPNKPGAAILVSRGGEVVHRAGYGLANMEWGIANMPDTVFRLGSMTKQFTAVAIMVLEEQGRLHIDDPINHYLPDFPTGGHEITLHHLLTHTSGIWNHTNHPDVMKRCRQDLNPREIAEEFWNHPLDFEPGTHWSYSNSGYILLGMIIEHVAGMTYANFLQTTIFKPLGMAQSYYMDHSRIIPKRASGYDGTGDEFRNAGWLSMSYPYAGGAVGSTIDDLARWDQALAKNQLISGEALARLRTPVRLADGSISSVGCGWFIYDYRSMQVVSHSGDIHGFSSNMLHIPASQVTIAVLLNRTDLDKARLCRMILHAIMGLDDAQESPTVELDDIDTGRYTGQYHLQFGITLEVIDDSGTLSLKEPGNPQIKPISETQFYRADDPDTLITFGNELGGRFTRLVMSPPLFPQLIGYRVDEDAGQAGSKRPSPIILSGL